MEVSTSNSASPMTSSSPIACHDVPMPIYKPHRRNSSERRMTGSRLSMTSSSTIPENDIFDPCFNHIDVGSSLSVDGFINVNLPSYHDLGYGGSHLASAEKIPSNGNHQHGHNATSETSLNHHHQHLVYPSSLLQNKTDQGAVTARQKVPSISDAISLRSWSELSSDQNELSTTTDSNPPTSPMKILSNRLFSGFMAATKPTDPSQGVFSSGRSGATPSKSRPTSNCTDDKVENNTAKNPFTNWMKSPSRQAQKPAPSNRLQPKLSITSSAQREVSSYDDSDDLVNPDKVKTKLLSMWNNVKYGWTVKLKTNFNENAPLFLLGRCYHRKIDESQSNDHRVSSLEQFRQDFSSRLWFTYRREFPQLTGSTLTTDCGWGCMLRSGQMMLAQALILHFLGRDWRWYSFQDVHHRALHRQIIRWFGDLPSNQNPFSVHRLVKFGETCLDKKPGDWYGPASVAHIMREAMDHAYELNPLLEMCVYVAYDCTVYIQDVVDLCTTRPRSSSTKNDATDETETATVADDYWRPVIMLIPIRLGGDKLNAIYMPCVQSLFAQDNCLGIIGGRPKHSLYFVGFQDDKLIHLDPHYCQDVVDMKARDFPLNTFHCLSPRKMSISRMDPSCTIGFYCKKKEDFFNFVEQTKELICPPMQKSQYPMFIFVDGHNEHTGLDHICQEEERYLRIQHRDSDGKMRKQSVSSEDFVFL
ncbi:cysteine protease ATG4C-like [Tubulanus polymorphus]|uniref:cysteine protease ATG4C-like n=1 Tax=Tubulanus polymorphus TaxID=672921 RepID=UPI003DA1D6B7